MYAKTMTYTDFDGKERKETFLFNLTKAEIAEMQLTTEGGFKEQLRTIIDTKDQPELIRHFKRIILAAYGEKSPDGKYFEKSEDRARKFSQTQAYSDLFMELATNTDSAIEFVNGIVPPDLLKEPVTAANA